MPEKARGSDDIASTVTRHGLHVRHVGVCMCVCMCVYVCECVCVRETERAGKGL